MDFGDAITLGVLQGATEFLPVSSSGHLVIAGRLLDAVPEQRTPTMEIVAHLGTLVPVIFALRGTLGRLVRYASVGLWRERRAGGWRAVWANEADGRLLLSVFTASFATGIVGAILFPHLHAAFDSPRAAGAGLLATGTILTASLLATGRLERKSSPGVGGASLIGLMQGLALFPGVSRSGSTIVVGLLLGLRREKAFEFSFLIAIPATIGAAIVELARSESLGAMGAGPATALFLSALVTGAAALAALRILVRHGRLGIFALYCFPLGLWALLRTWG